MNLNLQEQKNRIAILVTALLIASNLHSNPRPRVLLSRNALYSNTGISGYYSIGCIVDSFLTNRRRAIGIYGNFNNFKNSQISQRNKFEGITGMYLHKFKARKFDFYLGPSLTHRQVRYNYIGSSAISIERTWAIGAYTSAIYNFNRRLAISTEISTFISRVKYILKNTSTGYYNTYYSSWYNSYNKFFSLTLIINL